MTVTGGFVLQAATIRVQCDVTDPESGLPLYEGLWADVRRNLTNGERKALVEQAEAIDRQAEALNADREQMTERFRDALKAAEGDDAEQARLINEQIEWMNGLAEQMSEIGVQRFNLIAPHVHGWNLVDMDTAETLPAPRVDAAAALDAITPEIAGWLLRTTLQAYRLGFPIGSRQSGAQQEPTPEPSAGNPKGSGSSSRRSRAKSSSPDPSTFAA
jgi:hypothetical protein